MLAVVIVCQVFRMLDIYIYICVCVIVLSSVEVFSAAASEFPCKGQARIQMAPTGASMNEHNMLASIPLYESSVWQPSNHREFHSFVL